MHQILSLWFTNFTSSSIVFFHFKHSQDFGLSRIFASSTIKFDIRFNLFGFQPWAKVIYTKYSKQFK